jgi:hypothetical protein
MQLRLGIAGACVVLSACQIDRLSHQPPPPDGEILQAGASVVDSVQVGNTALVVDSLAVSNAGGGSVGWVAAIAHGSPWLSLLDKTGVTPARLHLRLDPTGLGVGMYRDTLIVSGVTQSSIVVVPVELRVTP